MPVTVPSAGKTLVNKTKIPPLSRVYSIREDRRGKQIIQMSEVLHAMEKGKVEQDKEDVSQTCAFSLASSVSSGNRYQGDISAVSYP